MQTCIHKIAQPDLNKQPLNLFMSSEVVSVICEQISLSCFDSSLFSPHCFIENVAVVFRV